MLLQDAGSVYETDQTTHVISALERMSGTRYADGGDAVRSFRVLCDHGRGMAAVATDGVTPSNEGRGYVLRRIIRRAVLHGSRIGLDGAVPRRAARRRSIESLADGYPELAEHRDDVRRLLEAEEERFSQTLATGSRAARRPDRAGRATAASRASTPATSSSCTTRTASRSS